MTPSRVSVDVRPLQSLTHPSVPAGRARVDRHVWRRADVVRRLWSRHMLLQRPHPALPGIREGGDTDGRHADGHQQRVQLLLAHVRYARDVDRRHALRRRLHTNRRHRGPVRLTHWQSLPQVGCHSLAVTSTGRVSLIGSHFHR